MAYFWRDQRVAHWWSNRVARRDPILRETLKLLGIPRHLVSRSRWRIVAHAERGDRPQSNTYATLNKDLMQAASEAPFLIRHITGEARVLIDPAHRNVIDKIGQQGIATWIACRQTGDISDAISFILAQRDRWSTLTWDDLLDIVNLAADGKVRLLTLRQEAPVHFSLYGPNRLLLQEPHPHPREQKLVWYIESEAFVKSLSELAETAFETAQPIPASSFAALRSWLHSSRIQPFIRARSISDAMLEGLTEEDVQRLLDLNIIVRRADDFALNKLPTLDHLAEERLVQAEESGDPLLESTEA